MEHTLAFELIEQGVNVGHLDPATHCPCQERLSARADWSPSQILARPPAKACGSASSRAHAFSLPDAGADGLSEGVESVREYSERRASV